MQLQADTRFPSTCNCCQSSLPGPNRHEQDAPGSVRRQELQAHMALRGQQGRKGCLPACTPTHEIMCTQPRSKEEEGACQPAPPRSNASNMPTPTRTHQRLAECLAHGTPRQPRLWGRPRPCH